MNAKILIVLGLAALAAADSDEFRGYGSNSRSFESYKSDEAKYDFNWNVNAERYRNHYGHQEARDGDDTQGSYYVQLPDGRLQKVSYYVDGDDGYVADVKYEGSASFESGSYESGSFESRESYRPRYRFDSNESK